MWQMQNSPELRPFCVCLFYAIYNVGKTWQRIHTRHRPGASATRITKVKTKSQCILTLHTSQKKNISFAFLCWNSGMQVCTSYHNNISYATLPLHQPKKSQQKTPKSTPNTSCLQDCGLACEKNIKTFEPVKKTKIPHISSQGNRLFTDPWMVDVLEVKVGKQKYHALSVWVWQNLYESQIEGSFGYWFST